jgi:phosphoribosylformylglycinamidine synthase I
MENVKAIVLRAAGINCDLETVHALELAGASADRVHINRIIENPAMLDDYQIMVFPGGFSYGDDVAAGKILANQIVHHFSGQMKKFIADGKLILGICNGFQILVKTGILPGFEAGQMAPLEDLPVSIIDNDSGIFEDRWAHLQVATDKCVFLDPGKRIYLPVAHGEGKVVTKDPATLEKLKENGHVAFRYVDADGNFGDFPVNPNGSTDHIAALCDATGRVMGLMPHPERFVHHTQHPNWTRLNDPTLADGMMIFNNAVKYVKENL